MIKNESYLTIQGWMVNELKLKGNELMVYAILYGFSQDGQGTYCGSQDYLAGWCNSTTRSVRKVLTSLLEKGLIEIKSTVVINGHKHHEYAVVQEQSSTTHRNKVPLPQEQSSATTGTKFLYPQEQSSYNNIVVDNIVDNIVDNKETKKNSPKKKTKKEPFDIDKALKQIENEELKNTLLEFIEMRKSIKAPLTTEFAVKQLLKRLDKLSNGDEEKKIEILSQSIVNSYRGIFPLKEENNNYQRQSNNSFNNFHQRKYSKDEMSELELRLLNRK